MSDLVLEDEEVIEIAGGYVRPSYQARILREFGIPHVRGRDGKLIVLREDAKASRRAGTARREAEPNLEGLARR